MLYQTSFGIRVSRFVAAFRSWPRTWSHVRIPALGWVVSVIKSWDRIMTINWMVVPNIVIFPYIGNNTPNWLLFFRGPEGLKPPTSKHDVTREKPKKSGWSHLLLCQKNIPEHQILITINKLLRVLISKKINIFQLISQKKYQYLETKVFIQKSISKFKKINININKKINIKINVRTNTQSIIPTSRSAWVQLQHLVFLVE